MAIRLLCSGMVMKKGAFAVLLHVSVEKIRIFNFVGTSIEIAGQGWWLVHPALDPNKIYEGWGHFGTTMKN